MVYTLLCSSQTIVNPVFDRTDHYEFHVEKIETDVDSTILYCSLSMEANSWANISPNTCIEDVLSGKKYPIIRSEGIPFSPSVRNFSSATICSVKLVFPSIKDATKINLIENPEKESFNIYGISLTESYEKSYRMSELELMSTRASLYESLNDTVKALQYKKEELEATRALYGTYSFPSALCNFLLSVLYEKYNDYYKAIKYAKDALECESYFIEDVTSSNYGETLAYLSELYYNISDFQTSYDYMQDAIKVFSNDWINNVNSLSESDKHLLWSRYHLYFESDFPKVVANIMSDSAVESLYNSILFSKGILQTNPIDYSINWRQVQDKLHENDIAIEFVGIYNHNNIDVSNSFFSVYALTLKKSSAPKFVKLFDFYPSSFINDLAEVDGLFVKIGNLIWGNLLDELKGINNIYFASTTVLNLFGGFEYFSVGGMSHFSDIYNVYRLSSTREIVLQDSHKANIQNVLLYGGLDYEESVASSNLRSGFDYLEGSLQEVNEISGLIKKKQINYTLLTGTKGTEGSFREKSKQNFDIIHFATHNVYLDDDELISQKIANNYGFVNVQTDKDILYDENRDLTHSFLLFSGANRNIKREQITPENDGFLTSLDISEMDLNGVDMVVLSACETGRGDPGVDDMLLGLARGFKKAGVNTILMSWHQVDDEATRILMVEFYRNLLDGKAKQESLKAAQKYLREYENGKYDDPRYWASFIMLDGLN